MKIVAVLLLCFVYFSVEAKELQDDKLQRRNLLKRDDIKNDAQLSLGDAMSHLNTARIERGVVGKIERFYDLRDNKCLTKRIKTIFWNLAYRALRSNNVRDLHDAMYNINRQVFKKLQDCPENNFFKWAEKETLKLRFKNLIKTIIYEFFYNRH